MQHAAYYKVTKIETDRFDVLCLLLSSEFHTRKMNVPFSVAQFLLGLLFFVVISFR